jgi:TrmH family RNA methyltransferase
MTVISSVNNPHIKAIRALRTRKGRAEQGTFFVEGLRIVGEAVQTGAEIVQIVTAPDLLISAFGRETAIRAEQNGAMRVEVTKAVFAALSEKDGPQGIAAVIRQRWTALEAFPARPDRLCYVALESPQDPGNIGTVIRTAEAVGAAGLILIGDSADPYDPGSVRASMGAIFDLPLARASFESFITWARERGIRIIGTSGASPTDYRAVRYAPPQALLMGSEREGLSAAQQAACDVVVRLPMVGRSDSLNLAVATGVMLYALLG